MDITKGQVISKGFFGLFNFFQRTNENTSHSSTVKDNPKLSDLKGPGTSKLDWRYFEHSKIDRNEL